jgi:hypothetical protein
VPEDALPNSGSCRSSAATRCPAGHGLQRRRRFSRPHRLGEKLLPDSHPDFPRPEPLEYYEAELRRLQDLQSWFVSGRSPYLPRHTWPDL